MKVFSSYNVYLDQKKKFKEVSYNNNELDNTRNKNIAEDDYFEIIIINDKDEAWFNLRDLKNLIFNCFENIDENRQ
ncbi:9170_t:CDS:1, partial [Dentiscutata erythropus]